MPYASMFQFQLLEVEYQFLIVYIRTERVNILSSINISGGNSIKGNFFLSGIVANKPMSTHTHQIHFILIVVGVGQIRALCGFL